MKINYTFNISTNEVICFSSCALGLLLQLFMNHIITLIVRPGVQVILSGSLIEQAQSTWSIMSLLPWMTSLNFNQQKATRKNYLMNYKADDILEGSFMAGHWYELLMQDKANHDSDTRILQPGLAPKVLFFLVLNACSSRNQNYKVVASFSTTKTEVFAETNCCSSLRGQ